jgi:hypothetical protein
MHFASHHTSRERQVRRHGFRQQRLDVLVAHQVIRSGHSYFLRFWDLCDVAKRRMTG